MTQEYLKPEIVEMSLSVEQAILTSSTTSSREDYDSIDVFE